MKKHLENAHMKGLITHYEKLEPFFMSPEDETKWLVNRLAEV